MEWIISAIVLLGGIAGYVIFRLKRVRHPSCPVCGYYIHGVASDRCSECGAALVEVGIQVPGMVNSRYSKRRIICVLLIIGALIFFGRTASMPWLIDVFEERQTAVFSALAADPTSGEYRLVRMRVRQTFWPAEDTDIRETRDVWVEIEFDAVGTSRHSALQIMDRYRDNGRPPYPWRADDDLQLGTAAVLDWMSAESVDTTSAAVRREAGEIARDIKANLSRERLAVFEMASFGELSTETAFEEPRIKLGWRVALELLWPGLFGVLGMVVLSVNRKSVLRHREQCRLAYAERALSLTTMPPDAVTGSGQAEE